MAGGLLIALYLLLITPLRLGVWLHWEGVSPGAAVGVRVWGAPGRWRLTIGRGGKRRAGAAHQRPGGAENAAKPPQAEKRAACAVCPAAGG